MLRKHVSVGKKFSQLSSSVGHMRMFCCFLRVAFNFLIFISTETFEPKGFGPPIYQTQTPRGCVHEVMRHKLGPGRME